ncbi:MAG TPA: type II toxin-antitoxin system Phd/YefM family antitoxin [Allosphingosinicella sp.]|jgi:antitoxin (DNA-binding transcriptional repressor) of toxin-antitoxin stability system
MATVNMLEAKTNLSKLVELLEKGAEHEIIIARNGRPAAVITAIRAKRGMRLGVAEGKIHVPDDFDDLDEQIASMFLGEDSAIGEAQP